MGMEKDIDISIILKKLATGLMTPCRESLLNVWPECLCPLKIHLLKPLPQGDGFKRRGLWEVIRFKCGCESRALPNGISALIKSQEILLLCPLCHVRIQ